MIAPEAKVPDLAQRDGVPHGPLAAFDFEIKKGETEINPPFIDPLKFKALSTTAEFRNFKPLAGDYIRWDGGIREIKWTYDGERWCAPHQSVQNIGIPLGRFAFIYGRTADVTAKLTLVGFLDEEKAKARSEK